MSSWREMLEEAKFLLSEGLITEDDYQDLKAEALNLMKQSRMNPSDTNTASFTQKKAPVVEDTLSGNTIEVDDVTGSDTLDGTTIEQDLVLNTDTLEGVTQKGMTLMGQSLELTENNYFQLQKGTMFDQRYTIALPLGKGGMGMVYQAVDTMTGQQVALKVLLPKFAKQKKVIDSLVHEFSLGQRLNHPNLLNIRHLETRGNTPYIVMELMDGGDAAELASSRGEVLNSKEILPVLEAVCSALSALHKEAIVHLDIKPQNILLAKDGRIRLADFGISSRMKDQRDGHSGAGTPWYAAPEQLDREVCGVGTDVYAVGMMTYRLLSGEFPFAKSATLDEIKQWHKKGKRKFLGVDPALRPILQKACHPSIEKRYRDIQELYIALSQHLVDNTPLEDQHQNPNLEKYRELYSKVMEDGYLEDWEQQQLEAARQKWNIRELQAKQIEADFLAKCSAELEVVYNVKNLLSAKAMDKVSIGLEFNNISLLNLEKIEVRCCSVEWNVHNIKTFSLKGQKSHSTKLSLCLDSVWTYTLQMMVHVQDFIGNDQYFVASQLPFSFDLDGVKLIQWEDRLVERQSEDKWKVSLMLSDQSTWQAFVKGTDKGKSEFANGRKKLQKRIEQRHAEEFMQRSKAWESRLTEYIELESTLKSLEKELQVVSEKQLQFRQTLDKALDDKKSEQEQALNQKSKARKELQAEMEGLDTILDEIPTLKEALRGRIFAKFNDDVQPKLSKEIYESLELSGVASDFIRTLKSLDVTEVAKMSAVTKHSLTTNALKDVLVKIIRHINVGYNQDPLQSEAKELEVEVSRLNSKIESYKTKEMDLLSRRMDLASKLKEEEAKFFSFFVKKTIQTLQEEEVQVVAELKQIEQSIQRTKKEIDDKRRDFKNRSFSAKQREYTKYTDELKRLHALYNDVRTGLVSTLQRKVEGHNTDKRNLEMELKEHKQKYETEYEAEERLLIQTKTEEYNSQKSLIEERIAKHDASVVEFEATFEAELEDFTASEEQKIVDALEGVDVAQLSRDISKNENELSALECKLVMDLPFTKKDLLKYEHLVTDTILLYYSTFALNMNLQVSDFKSSLVQLNQAVYKLLQATTYNLQAPQFSMIAKQSVSALKSHPKIRVVSTKSNIQEAIDAAQTGEVLVLLKGVYEQNITISKDVYVLGQSGATIRGVSDTDVIKIKKASPVLYGLNIDSVWDGGLNEGLGVFSYERLMVVEGVNAKPIIAACFFTSKATSGVLCRGASTQLMNNRFDGVRGYGVKFARNSTGKLEDSTFIKMGKEGVIVDGANPNIVRNHICDGKDVGIYIHNKSTGLIQDTKIYRNMKSNINITGESHPKVINNEIYEGKQSGVYVYDKGLGHIENNKIYGNGYSGVSIKTEGNPRIVNNKIYNGKQGGVYVYDKGLGHIENNKIYGNGYPSVSIKTEGNPKVINNEIYDGKQNGVYVYDKGLGHIENNKIYGHGYPSVAVKTEGNPKVINNEIYEGKQSGVYVYDKGLGHIENNKIHGHDSSEVLIRTEGNPRIVNNEIYDGKQNGVYVHEKGLGHIENNKIYGNKHSNIRITTGADPVIRKNRVYNGKQDGIWIQDNGFGTLTDNTIYKNKFNGIDVNKSSPKIRGNTIYENRKNGLKVHGKSGGVYENNTLRSNALDDDQGTSSMVLSDVQNPVVKGNKISSTRGGIIVQNASSVTIDNHVFSNNERNSVDIREGSKARILNSSFVKGKAGALVWGDSTATIQNCTFKQQTVYGIGCGIKSTDKGSVTIKNCTIENSEANGMQIRGSGMVVDVRDCVMKNNISSSIRVQDGAKANISECTISNGSNGGIFFKGKSKGVVEKCKISNNKLSNIAVHEGSFPVIRHNQIFNGQAEGISVLDSNPHIHINEIYQNAAANVVVVNSSPTINGNVIKNGKRSGLWYKKGSKGVCEHNTITGNTFSGVVISTGCTPTIRSNRITHNKGNGVWVQEGAGGAIVDNELSNNRKVALSFDEGHKCTHSNNTT